jgi:Fe-S cluster assembly protein SufD
MTGVPTDRIRDIVGRLPTTREEDWKYTDLGRAREISERWLEAGAPSPARALDGEIAMLTDSIDASWFVLQNGVLLESPDTEDFGYERLGSAPVADSALAELNAALLRDGIRIAVDGKLDRPIGLLVIDGADEASVSQARIEIAFADDAAGDIIEIQHSVGDGDQYNNSFLAITLGTNAAANHVRVQNRALSHVQTTRTTVTAGRNSRFRSAAFDLGGGLIRNDLVIDIAEPGADVGFDGLYLAGDGQHIDNHTRVDHRVGPATSRQEYRGILNGQCRCVWNGKAIVHDGADGTDADQANHNLLLSERAEIDTKPELEIYTDDVKCSHGTTVGQLDETSLFYLRTRGLDERRAIQVLTHAFAAGLVSRVPIDAVKERVSQLMEQRLGQLIDTDEDLSQ